MTNELITALERQAEIIENALETLKALETNDAALRRLIA